MTRTLHPDPLSPFDEPEREFHSRRRLSYAPNNSPEHGISSEEDDLVFHNNLVKTAEYGYYSDSEFGEDKVPSRPPTIYPTDSESEQDQRIEMADIADMTLEDYTIQTRGDPRPGVVRPAIERGVEFELKGQFLKELRENPFRGEDKEDANEHVEKILEIADMFHIPNVTRDQVMLRVFPLTLKDGAKRWINNEPAGSITTWEDLRTKFLKMYCTPSKTSKMIDEIRNFKQKPDESLYQAWERYKEMMHKCPQHDLNVQQEITVFYKGVDRATRQQLDAQGPVPKKTPALAKAGIEELAKHSQLWDDGSSGRKRMSEDNDGLAAITAKLESMGRDIKKVNEQVHAIRIGCEICGGSHLKTECPNDSQVVNEEVMYGDFQGNSNYRQVSNFRRVNQPSQQYQQGAPGYYVKTGQNTSYDNRMMVIENALGKLAE